VSYWPAFILRNIRYSTNHLDAIDHVIIQLATDKDPERVYHLRIKFSHHLFTDPKATSGLTYCDSRGMDCRSVCVDRYGTSFTAVDIIKSLGEKVKVCFATDERNHFIFKFYETHSILDRRLERNSLEVYFRLKKYNKIEGWFEIMVESAYTVGQERRGRQPSGKISLFTLLAREKLKLKI
jgi:hypothetical protein